MPQEESPSSSSASRPKSRGPKSPEMELPDWLAFLTPSKNQHSRSSIRDEDPFGVKKRGILLFPPEKKPPLVISGQHSQGNLQTIDETKQTLLKNISPFRPIRPPPANETHNTASSDVCKKVPVTIPSSFLKWVLLALFVIGAWLVLLPHYNTKSQQPDIISSPPIPSPPSSMPPLPVSEPKSKSRFKSTTITKEKTSESNPGIPRRIANIIKQELSPFPPSTSSKDTTSSVESSSSPPPPPSLSPSAFKTITGNNKNPTTDTPLARIVDHGSSNKPSSTTARTTRSTIHEFQSQTYKIAKELLRQIQKIIREVQSQLANFVKQVKSQVQGIIATALQSNQLDDDSSMDSRTSPKMRQDEQQDECAHSWKWVFHRSCRREREQRELLVLRQMMSSPIPMNGGNVNGVSIDSSDYEVESPSTCQNLLLRECRQQKRAAELTAPAPARELQRMSPATSASARLLGQQTTTKLTSPPRGAEPSAASAPSKPPSVRDTRYSAIVMKAFGPGGKHSGMKKIRV